MKSKTGKSEAGVGEVPANTAVAPGKQVSHLNSQSLGFRITKME